MDLGALLNQAKALQERMEYLQKGLASTIVEGSAGAGMVKVKVTADQKVVDVAIDPSVLEPIAKSTSGVVSKEDQEMLQDLVLAAVNQALDNARAVASERMSSMMPPGMMPPGFPGMPR